MKRNNLNSFHINKNKYLSLIIILTIINLLHSHYRPLAFLGFLLILLFLQLLLLLLRPFPLLFIANPS
ncbi:hypothetical protein Hanom_Chr08g00716601 [Helianthus anomalus]